jgi:hypothetical protein
LKKVKAAPQVVIENGKVVTAVANSDELKVVVSNLNNNNR